MCLEQLDYRSEVRQGEGKVKQKRTEREIHSSYAYTPLEHESRVLMKEHAALSLPPFDISPRRRKHQPRLQSVHTPFKS